MSIASIELHNALTEFVATIRKRLFKVVSKFTEICWVNFVLTSMHCESKIFRAKYGKTFCVICISYKINFLTLNFFMRSLCFLPVPALSLKSSYSQTSMHSPPLSVSQSFPIELRIVNVDEIAAGNKTKAMQQNTTQITFIFLA